MLPGGAGTETVRAASTELPSWNRQTGRPVAKFRKCVPTGCSSAGLLVEVGLGVGEQPGAVRLARVLLDADRVQNQEERALRSGRPGVERISRRRLRRGLRERRGGDQAADRQNAGEGRQDA